MSDDGERVRALLEQLVDLQQTANEQQRQALQKTEQYHAEARRRAEQAIELQQLAVSRQRWAMRVWLGAIVFVLACVAGLLIVLSHYLH